MQTEKHAEEQLRDEITQLAALADLRLVPYVPDPDASDRILTRALAPRRRRRQWALLGGVAAAGVGLGVALGPLGLWKTDSPDTAAAVSSAESWTHSYATVAELTEHADVVVRAQATEIVESDLDNRDLNARFQLVRFEVSDWIKGDVETKDVLVRQTVIEGPGISSGLDDPPIEIGQESILFLTEYEGGRFYILGGPTGRVLIENGQPMVLPGSTLEDADTL